MRSTRCQRSGVEAAAQLYNARAEMLPVISHTGLSSHRVERGFVKAVPHARLSSDTGFLGPVSGRHGFLWSYYLHVSINQSLKPKTRPYGPTRCPTAGQVGWLPANHRRLLTVKLIARGCCPVVTAATSAAARAAGCHVTSVGSWRRCAAQCCPWAAPHLRGRQLMASWPGRA